MKNIIQNIIRPLAIPDPQLSSEINNNLIRVLEDNRQRVEIGLRDGLHDFAFRNLTLAGTLTVTGTTALSALALSGILTVDTINEYTTAAGITIDGVLLKDGDVQLTTGNWIGLGAADIRFDFDGPGGEIDCQATLDMNSNTIDNAGSIHSSGTLYVDDILEETLNAGVTIDGVQFKDGNVIVTNAQTVGGTASAYFYFNLAAGEITSFAALLMDGNDLRNVGNVHIDSGNLYLDNTGATVDSRILYLRGDVGGTEVEATLQLMQGADPYLRISVDDDSATPALTATLDIFDDCLMPSADDAVDLGKIGNEFKDLFIDGTANIDSLVADTADINAGTWQGTIDGNWTAAGQTCADLGTVTTANIDGGTIDGTAIGGAAACNIGTGVAGTGAFTTLSASGDIFTTAWTSYGATSTVIGWAATPTKQIYYKRIGNIAFIWFRITGTSNDTVATFTVPFTNKNIANLPASVCVATKDNGAWQTTGGMVNLASNSTTVTLYKNMAGAAWTASGAKTTYGQFCYEVE